MSFFNYQTQSLKLSQNRLHSAVETNEMIARTTIFIRVHSAKSEGRIAITNQVTTVSQHLPEDKQKVWFEINSFDDEENDFNLNQAE